jgi:ADP-ribose pyrophosphatase YjhB (NUDIX family)
MTREGHASVELGAGVYVMHDDRLLLVEQQRGDRVTWGALGGGVLANESIEAAAIREAREESGLCVRLVRPIVIDQVWSASSFVGLVITFLAEPDGWPQEVRLPELDGATRFLRSGWFTRDEIAGIPNMHADEMCRVAWPCDITSPYMRTVSW